MNVNVYNPYVRRELELYHHGIYGQKWGKRNGPPYPLDASEHSAREKKAGWKDSLGKGDYTKSGKYKKSSNLKSKDEDKDTVVETDGSSSEGTVTDEELIKKFNEVKEKVGFIPTKQQNYERNKYMPIDKLPQTEDECKRLGWDNGVASDCHQFTSKDKSNRKWVSPDGKLEVIFDKDGKIVTDPADYGTYNFSSPNDNPLGHFTQDVIPWLLWGNSPEDSTNVAQRFNAFFVNGTFSLGKKVYHAVRHKGNDNSVKHSEELELNINIYNPYIYRGTELYHHGIAGMKWGERNGPPYPLTGSKMSSSERRNEKAEHKKERQERREARRKYRKQLKEDRKRENIKALSDEELNKRINRMKRENEYSRLLGRSEINGENTGKRMARQALNSVGTMLVVPMAVGAATYGIKTGFNELGPNVASNHMDMWTGLGKEMFKNVNRMKK